MIRTFAKSYQILAHVIIVQISRLHGSHMDIDAKGDDVRERRAMARRKNKEIEEWSIIEYYQNAIHTDTLRLLYDMRIHTRTHT